jgi:uncharacterized protein YggT (Ycf19 family)
MSLFLYIILNILIIGLFLYSKLTPHKDRLEGNYLKIFNVFERIFEPILNFLRAIAKPARVGNGLAVDMSQILLLVIFLLLLKYLL